MPRPHPPEFRRRAVELAREKAKPISQLARDLGVSESCLRNWMVKADIEHGRREGPSTDAQAELVELRRKLRVGPWGTSARKVPLRMLPLRWPGRGG